MGFFNLLKRDKGSDHQNGDNLITDPSIDNLAISSLSTAYLILEEKLGLKTTGRCGILVKNVNIPDFIDMKQYIDNFLANVSDKQNIGWDFSYRSMVDNHGYLWFIVEGRSIEDIVVAINAIGDTVHEKGFSRQLLAAIFEFTSGYDIDNNKIKYINNSNNKNNQYLIYNYKIDKFYPFVPLPSAMTDNHKKERNHRKELKIMTLILDEIPFEKDMSLWYPIWNIPF